MTLPRNQPRAYHLREASEELLALMELLNLIDMATAKIGESEGAAIRQGCEQAMRMVTNASESIHWAEEAAA